MKFMCIDKWQPGTKLEQILALQKEELAFGWKLYQQGVIRDWYFREDHPGVVIMFECASLAEVRKHLDEMPMVKQNLIDFDIIPLGYFRSLEVLFSNDVVEKDKNMVAAG
jgi:hypothetical protein